VSCIAYWIYAGVSGPPCSSVTSLRLGTFRNSASDASESERLVIAAAIVFTSTKKPRRTGTLEFLRIPRGVRCLGGAVKRIIDARRDRCFICTRDLHQFSESWKLKPPRIGRRRAEL